MKREIFKITGQILDNPAPGWKGPWIGLYLRGGRFGSFALTEGNLAYLKARLHLSLIQIDTSGGHHHYTILGVKKKVRHA